MPLKQDVLDAFQTLGLTPDADLTDATKAYKRLALLHHPDRNHGDSSATQRFQQIGAAWNICQRHYDNPAWSNVPDHAHSPFGFGSDDDIPLDEEDLYDFYMFMFAETLFNRYSRASGQRYRYEHRHHGGGIFTFSRSYSESQEDRRSTTVDWQQREKAEYERRKRELELEIQEEERERKRQAKKAKADEDRLANAQEHAFQTAQRGNSAEVQKTVVEFDLDVNAPRNLRQAKNIKKQDDTVQYETLLHLAASHCDASLLMFLIERGAKPTTLNKQQLTPFHAAIRAGNTSVVTSILEHRGKAFEGCHPSKATPSGSTPLQLAIESGNPSTVELLVKHATTHDVERCWKHASITEEIKEVLRTKKGFVPPGEGLAQDNVSAASKKAQRLLEQAQQKEAQIAEERRRAEVNRQKREERAAKRAVIEKEQAERAQQEEAKRKAEEEQCRRVEEERAGLEEAKRKAEGEERQRLEQERRRVEAEEKRRLDEIRKATEARARQLEEARLKAAEEARVRAEKEKKEREAKEALLRAEQARLERAAKEALARAEQAEKERVAKEALVRAEQAKKTRELQEARVQAEAAKVQATNARTNIVKGNLREASNKVKPSTSPVASSSMQPRNVKPKPAHAKIALSEEERMELRRAKLKEKRKARKAERLEQAERVPSVANAPQPPAPSTTAPHTPPPVSKPAGKKSQPPIDVEHMNEFQRKKHEAAMQRRAEQSARDKERHRLLVEERKKAKLQSRSRAESEPSEYVPPTPVSTHTARGPSSMKGSSLNSVPQPAFELPLFVEDIQTCVVPEDLFRPERPRAGLSKPEGVSNAQTTSTEPQIIPPSTKSYRKFYKYPKRERPVTQHS